VWRSRGSAYFPSVLSSGWSRNLTATPFFFSPCTVVRRWQSPGWAAGQSGGPGAPASQFALMAGAAVDVLSRHCSDMTEVS
jgi:hypothetical protein